MPQSWLSEQKLLFLKKLFVSAKNIWNKVLCIIVIEDLDDNQTSTDNFE